MALFQSIEKVHAELEKLRSDFAQVRTEMLNDRVIRAEHHLRFNVVLFPASEARMRACCQLLGTSEPEAPERRFQHDAVSHCPAYERSRSRALKWSGSSATERARHTGQSRRQQAYGDLANAGAACPGPRYP